VINPTSVVHGICVAPETPLPIEGDRFRLNTSHDRLARLLPDATMLHLDTCTIDDATAQITLRVPFFPF
jgi:hypothetical protein